MFCQTEVVPTRPLLGNPAADEAENDEPVDLGLAPRLAMTGPHRHPRRKAIAVSKDVAHIEVRPFECLGMVFEQVRQLLGVTLLGARKRVNVPAVVVG